jgi:transcriptional regulator with XRE-family HTH domain
MSGRKKWSEIRAGALREDREPLRTLGELRRENGLSQQDMAEELGVSQASISKIERQDDPQVSTLMRYLDALGANLELRAVFRDRSARLYMLADKEAAGNEPADGRIPVDGAIQVEPVTAYDATRG